MKHPQRRSQPAAFDQLDVEPVETPGQACDIRFFDAAFVGKDGQNAMSPDLRHPGVLIGRKWLLQKCNPDVAGSLRDEWDLLRSPRGVCIDGDDFCPCEPLHHFHARLRTHLDLYTGESLQFSSGLLEVFPLTNGQSAKGMHRRGGPAGGQLRNARSPAPCQPFPKSQVDRTLRRARGGDSWPDLFPDPGDLLDGTGNESFQELLHPLELLDHTRRTLVVKGIRRSFTEARDSVVLQVEDDVLHLPFRRPADPESPPRMEAADLKFRFHGTISGVIKSVIPLQTSLLSAERYGETVENRPLQVTANFPLDGGGSNGESPGHSTLIIGGMHGNEPATVSLVESFVAAFLASGDLRAPVAAIAMANPDGCHRNSRYNARGVDLNRNFPYRWSKYSEEPAGPRPLSEPESVALRNLILRLRPRRIVSLHWALAEVEADGPLGNGLAQAMWDALSKEEQLPYRLRLYDLHSPPYEYCPGSLGQWVGHDPRLSWKDRPAMVTLELPYAPELPRIDDALPCDHLAWIRGRWAEDPGAYLRQTEGAVHKMLLAACRGDQGNKPRTPAPESHTGA